MNVLGIESSCDETGLAIYNTERGLLSHSLHTQIDLHAQYGGVVPELASRDHVKYLIPLLNDTLLKANITKKEIDVIAYTAGPGLIGALLVGASFAKSLAFSLNIPSIAINHLEAHILAAMLACPELEFPFIALLVSGGHTQLIKASALGDYKLLGDTLDDAVGEAFDKTAKLMGLPYPGGAALARLADSDLDKSINIEKFPRPMLKNKNLNFSFSGLKTHALLAWNKSDKTDTAKKTLARAFQDSIVDVLVTKAHRAIVQENCNKLVIAGGVGANRALREALNNLANDLGAKVYYPAIEFCTDNGAMVAYAGALHYLQGKKDLSMELLISSKSFLT